MSQTDQMRHWQIKSIPERVAEEITEAARVSTPKQTVGQLIETVWNHWQSGGTIVTGPHAVAPPAPTVDEVVSALKAVADISHLGDTIQLGVKNEASRLAKILLLDLKRRYLLAVGTGQIPLHQANAVVSAIDTAATTRQLAA